MRSCRTSTYSKPTRMSSGYYLPCAIWGIISREHTLTSEVPAMVIVVEAIYEDGVLKPAQPLPLSEHEKVEVTVRPGVTWADLEQPGLLGGRAARSWPIALPQTPNWTSRRLRRSHDLRRYSGGASVFVDANTLYTISNLIPSLGLRAPPCSSASNWGRSLA